MSETIYTIVESVGKSIETVHSYSDLAKHHPSAGIEPNRKYETIDGHLEEVTKTVDGRILIKKDFVLQINGSNQAIPVPCPISGYVETKKSFGTVNIYDSPNGKLIGRVLHLRTDFFVKNGEYVDYGKPIGIQYGTGAGGNRTFAIHTHLELEREQYLKYINDLASGVIRPPAKNENLIKKEPDGLQSYQLPLRKADGGSYSFDEIYKILEEESSGHYLLGNHNFWHGGIHFTDQSAPQCVDIEPIRCIADGEVIAYRLNKNYLTSEFTGNSACEQLEYSTSFCLVKHNYISPKNKEDGLNKGKQNKLTFYSLYMHLSSYDTYKKNKSNSFNLKVINGGWNARDLPIDEKESQIIGKIPTGVEFEILEERNTADNKYRFAQGRILKGNIGQKKLNDTVWFAIKENGEFLKDSQGNVRFKKIPSMEKLQPSYWSGIVEARVTVPSGLKVRSKPVGGKVGDQLLPNQVLHMGSIIRFNSEQILNLVFPDGNKYPVAECELVSGGLKGEGILPNKFWACVSTDEKYKFLEIHSLTPSIFDSVVIPKCSIKAGDPVGYMGLYETPSSSEAGKKNSKHQLHFEIFTSEEHLSDFLKNSAALKIGRRFLKIASGTPISIELDEEKYSEEKTLTEHILPYSQLEPFKDKSGNEYLKLKIIESQTQKVALIKKSSIGSKGIELICQLDWEKLGFRIVKNNENEQNNYISLNSTPDFFKTIYNEIDKTGDGNGEVTPIELKNSLRDKNLREQWSKIIAYHPTEWSGNSENEKWSILKELLKDYPEILKHESKRIDDLVFWDEIYKSDSYCVPESIYHFHPIAFLEHITINKIDHKWARSSFAELLGKVESNNDYSAYNSLRPLKSYYNTNLTRMTIEEVMKNQADGYMFATGRYQIVTATLEDAVKSLNLDKKLKYDSEMQDKIFEDYILRIKRKPIIDFLEANGSVEEAIYAWAKEFASAGVRKGKKISPVLLKDKDGKPLKDQNGKKIYKNRTAQFEGESYYSNDGLNTAHIMPDDMIKVLEESKKNEL